MLVAPCLAAFSLSSCAWNQRLAEERAETAKANAQPQLYDWRGDAIPGPASVRIVLNEQKAYIFRNGQEAGWTYLASGTSAHNTPTGTFSILEKQAQKSSNTYGVIKNAAGDVVDWDAKAGRDPVPRGGHFVGAPMPYWMRLTSYGIGMHAGPIPHPGLPASHGCIRLPEQMAVKLFNVVDVGTTVTIEGHAPSPQDYVARPTEVVKRAIVVRTNGAQ
jgi:hypothetical protein